MSKPIHERLVASPIGVARKALDRGKNVFMIAGWMLSWEELWIVLERAMDHKENEAERHFVVRKT